MNASLREDLAYYDETVTTLMLSSRRWMGWWIVMSPRTWWRSVNGYRRCKISLQMGCFHFFCRNCPLFQYKQMYLYYIRLNTVRHRVERLVAECVFMLREMASRSRVNGRLAFPLRVRNDVRPTEITLSKSKNRKLPAWGQSGFSDATQLHEWRK